LAEALEWAKSHANELSTDDLEFLRHSERKNQGEVMDQIIAAALGLVAMIRNVLGLQGMGGDNQGIAVGLLLILSYALPNKSFQEVRASYRK
jgi:hypothetical protein